MSEYSSSQSDLVSSGHVVTDALGVSLPFNDHHAVSVSLPLWQHVVGYEEGHKFIIDSMISGYPRFRFHNYVQYIMDLALIAHRRQALLSTLHSSTKNTAEEWSCMLFPAVCVSDRFQRFMVCILILVLDLILFNSTCLLFLRVIVKFLLLAFSSQVLLFMFHSSPQPLLPL